MENLLIWYIVGICRFNITPCTFPRPKIHNSPTWTGPGGKWSYRSAIHQKVRLFAGSVCPWPQGQAEVGRDQDPPGNTSHGPNKLKFGQTY